MGEKLRMKVVRACTGSKRAGRSLGCTLLFEIYNIREIASEMSKYLYPMKYKVA